MEKSFAADNVKRCKLNSEDIKIKSKKEKKTMIIGKNKVNQKWIFCT